MIRDILGQAWKRFTEPIRKYWFLILGLTIPIFVAAMYAEVRLTELAQAKSDEVLCIACEAATESGYDYVEAMRDHAEILEAYINAEHRRNWFASYLLYMLYPELDHERRLKPLLEDLKGPLSEQEKAKDQIERAAHVLEEFSEELRASSDVSSTALRFRSVGIELLSAINEAIELSHEAVVEYGKALNMPNAQKTCRKNRKTITLIFFGRSAYLSEVNKCVLRGVLEDVTQIIAYNEKLQKTLKSERDRSLLTKYSDSEKRRVKILQAILENDVIKARKILRKAIEDAFETEGELG